MFVTGIIIGVCLGLAIAGLIRAVGVVAKRINDRREMKIVNNGLDAICNSATYLRTYGLTEDDIKSVITENCCITFTEMINGKREVIVFYKKEKKNG